MPIGAVPVVTFWESYPGDLQLFPKYFLRFCDGVSEPQVEIVRTLTDDIRPHADDSESSFAGPSFAAFDQQVARPRAAEPRIHYEIRDFRAGFARERVNLG